MSKTKRDRPASRAALWFGLLGGAFAWTIHLVAAYGIAEFGCAGRLAEHEYLGITSVAWFELALSIATTLVATASTIMAYRTFRRLRSTAARDDTHVAAERNTARAGLLTSGTFTFIIIFESIPILYYLHHC